MNYEILYVDNIESLWNLKGEKVWFEEVILDLLWIFVVKWFVDCLIVDSIR